MGWQCYFKISKLFSLRDDCAQTYFLAKTKICFIIKLCKGGYTRNLSIHKRLVKVISFFKIIHLWLFHFSSNFKSVNLFGAIEEYKSSIIQHNTTYSASIPLWHSLLRSDKRLDKLIYTYRIVYNSNPDWS